MPPDLAEFTAELHSGDTILVEGGAAASLTLPRMLCNTPNLPPLAVTGIMVPGINEESWSHPALQVETFFMTRTLAQREPAVRLLPLPYTAIEKRFRKNSPAVALVSVSRPDEKGLCSFGPTVDFIADLWDRIPLLIAHVNPAIPMCEGPKVPFAKLRVACEETQPLFTIEKTPTDEVSQSIAAHVAPFIGNGATIQTGLGRIPDSVLAALYNRRDLRFHTGLIGDGVLDLLECGAIRSGQDVTTGAAIGSQQLYDALPASGFQFAPVRITHAWRSIADCENFVAVNSALCVDLLGQAYSERTAKGWMSGTGGATDFARGAALGNGLRIVALPARTGTVSRIIAANEGEGPVTLAREDIDVVVTEHGAADLRGLDTNERARALIAIAEPLARETLSRGWHDAVGSLWNKDNL